MKVSVIVPVYNSEEYLHRCIDSILNQLYNNLEVILINDGSKDKSEEDTERSKELLKKFDAISVREDSAIDLIKTNLSRTDAQHVLDPTMLLPPPSV